MSDTNTNTTDAANGVEQQPELTAEQKERIQRQEDYGNLNAIGQHLEATKVALSLKAVTPKEQTERHALFDRIISHGGPLIVADAPVWNIEEKPAQP